MSFDILMLFVIVIYLNFGGYQELHTLNNNIYLGLTAL